MNILQHITLNPPHAGDQPPLAPASDQPRDHVWTPMDGISLSHPLDHYVGKDQAPLPHTHEREAYHGDRHFDYWLSGLADYLRIEQTAARHESPLRPGDRVLELGCASGRLLRHFAAQRPDLETWGADINQAHIDWVSRWLPRSILPFQCSAFPHLPIPDGHFSLIAALSVFTHIEVLEIAWLLELRRCLRPGGIAYLSLHTEATWSSLNPLSSTWAAIQACKEQFPEFDLTEEGFRSKPMPSDRIVFDLRSRSLYNTNVFHHTKYIHETWGRFFEVRDIIRCGHGGQDVAVLRKRAESRHPA